MIRRMQWRFILSAMAVFGAVMIILAVGINLANYLIITGTQDNMLVRVLGYGQKDMSSSLEEMSERNWGGGQGADFATRFFAVHFNTEKEAEVFISKQYAAFIEEGAVKQYAAEILSDGSLKGLYKNYRYRVKEGNSGSMVVFLDASRELQMMSVLFIISVIVVTGSLSVVFVLIVAISKRVVKPYIRNMERQKRFITDASHELKTPLTSIATSADIIALESDESEWVSNIQKQTMRLTRLVSDLITLSRFDEEAPFQERSVFSVSEAAWEIAEPFAALARENGKIYTGHIEEHLEFMGDRGAIQQMISILLDNAVRYSQQGGEIWLDIYRRHGKICMEVCNTCEFPKEIEPERLFDRFYRPDESRSANSGGTGIGLSIAQAVIEAHGGKITVECPDGEKIFFRVVL